MKTKLVSANMGIVLIVERDGEQQKVEFSLSSSEQPSAFVGKLCNFIMEELEMDYLRDTVSIAKPKKIKAPRTVSQKEFNKKIKELGY